VVPQKFILDHKASTQIINFNTTDPIKEAVNEGQILTENETVCNGEN
jgi:hypothetical protein